MSDTPDAAPTPRTIPGPPGFIPVLPPRSRADIDAGRMPSHYDLVPQRVAAGDEGRMPDVRYLGSGGTAHALADANRYDALVGLLAEVDSIATSTMSRLPARDHDALLEAAARVRIAFGLRKS